VMSSEQNSQLPPREGGLNGGVSRIGWGAGFLIALYYVGFFSIVCVTLFGVTYVGVGREIRERELEIVRDRAAEYRAWFRSGHLQMLNERIGEQSLQPGDVMFVRVVGPGIDAIEFNPPEAGSFSVDELRQLSPTAEAAEIEIGGERWAVASLPVGNRGAVLQAGKNARATEDVLAGLRRLFLLTLIPAGLLAMLGGALLTYRAMAPIRRLTGTMYDILRAGDLGKRVEPQRGSNELNALVELFNRLLARNENLIHGMHNSLDSVAHDMRTPLSRLNNMAERALGEAGDPELMREALADCVEESDNLGRLLTTLMDVAEAESGAMRLDREILSVPALIESVAELYEFVAEERSITVTTELPAELEVIADRTRLNQVLANLVDNAIKYSPAGSEVKISAVAEADGGTVIRVSDQGLGISEADLPHIWDRLFRAERSRTAPGMGLGLSFVRAVVEAHGGSVACTSNLNSGSTFTVRLPG
ncbi:MAG: HAMP domain-containing sensor histidine kinase, partial [Verrucomicrobiales bacterium]